MNLTKFRDKDGNDGPVSGAIQTWELEIGIGLVNVAYVRRIDLPKGAKLKVTHAKAYADALAGDPSLTIGSDTAATAIVAAINLTTNLGALTVKTTSDSNIIGSNTTGTQLVVTITNDADDTFSGANINLYGHIVQAPTTYDDRVTD